MFQFRLFMLLVVLFSVSMLVTEGRTYHPYYYDEQTCDQSCYVECYGDGYCTDSNNLWYCNCYD